MQQLRDVITRFLYLAGPRGVNRTMLNKLVYFAELESWQRHGRPLTGVSFYRFNYGAWAPDVKAVAEGVPHIEHKWFSGFYPEHNYRLRDECDVPELPAEAEDILVFVCEKYSRLTAAYVGQLSKQSEPMLAAPNHGDSLDFSVVAPRRPSLRVRNSRLARAQADLDLTRQGTADEIDARDAQEIEAWRDMRRRASSSLANH